MTQQGKRPLFREHALQKYMQRRENDVLPRIVSPPVFICVWIIFGLVVASGLMAWLERVPVYVNGSGVVLTTGKNPNSSQNIVDALVFIPVTASGQIRTGIHGKTQFRESGAYFDSTITSFELSELSPAAIQKYYQLSCSAAQKVVEPSIVVHISVMVPMNNPIFKGTSLQAQLQTGSQRVLALLPVFDGLIGDS